MQSAVASMLIGHGVLGCEFRARPETRAAPFKICVLRQGIGKARLPDCFSQQKLDALVELLQQRGLLFDGQFFCVARSESLAKFSRIIISRENDRRYCRPSGGRLKIRFNGTVIFRLFGEHRSGFARLFIKQFLSGELLSEAAERIAIKSAKRRHDYAPNASD